MKKISLFIIFLYIVFGAVCQPQQKDIVLSKKVQKINKQKEVINFAKDTALYNRKLKDMPTCMTNV